MMRHAHKPGCGGGRGVANGPGTGGTQDTQLMGAGCELADRSQTGRGAAAALARTVLMARKSLIQLGTSKSSRIREPSEGGRARCVEVPSEGAGEEDSAEAGRLLPLGKWRGQFRRRVEYCCCCCSCSVGK